MRDIIFLIFFLLTIRMVFTKPVVGLALSIWVSLITPSFWLYGFAKEFRYNFAYMAVTFFSYIVKNSSNVKKSLDGLGVFVIIFFIHGSISALTTIGIKEIAYIEWDYFWKTIIIYFMGYYIVQNKYDLIFIIKCLCLAFGFYGSLEALKFILSGGGHVITGISGGKFADRNPVALGISMVIPYLVFLLNREKNKIVKYLLLITCTLSIVAVVASYSRGGLITLLTVAICFLILSKSKIKIILISLIFGSIIFNTMPDNWSDRMSTIGSAKNDESFMGRVVAWKASLMIANDHPFFGGGFKSGQVQFVWDLYYDDIQKSNLLTDTSQYEFKEAKAAHSIYFQLLTDAGYMGLIIYILMIYFCFKNLFKCTKSIDEDIKSISVASIISLTAFLFGGAALSLPYFDQVFIIFFFSSCLAFINDSGES